MTSCTSFPFFSSLPTELRLKIWSLNLPGPRLVSLRYTSTISDHAIPSTRKKLRGCTSSTPIPINLQVNKEARSHALKHYQLSFNLPHCQPKIWFDMEQDVLYFPAKEGWLGSWNHFVNALTMTAPVEFGKVKRLAVHEALFRGVNGATSSPNVQATCVKEFWAYVRKKFGCIEETVVLIDRNGEGKQQEDVRIWMEGVLGCVLSSKGDMGIGSPEERLVEGLESGLRFVEEKNGWKAPRWDVMRFPGDDTGIADWPNEFLALQSCDLPGLEKWAVIDNVVIPRWKAVPKEEKGFWMGGELTYWRYLTDS